MALGFFLPLLKYPFDSDPLDAWGAAASYMLVAEWILSYNSTDYSINSKQASCYRQFSTNIKLKLEGLGFNLMNFQFNFSG